jgi:hypothetical protein
MLLDVSSFLTFFHFDLIPNSIYKQRPRQKNHHAKQTFYIDIFRFFLKPTADGSPKLNGFIQMLSLYGIYCSIPKMLCDPYRYFIGA